MQKDSHLQCKTNLATHAGCSPLWRAPTGCWRLKTLEAGMQESLQIG